METLIRGEIPTLDKGHHSGAPVDGRRKDRSYPSVMSLVKEGMSGRTAKVKPRPAPPSQQGPGGRFRGTCETDPLGNGV